MNGVSTHQTSSFLGFKTSNPIAGIWNLAGRINGFVFNHKILLGYLAFFGCLSSASASYPNKRVVGDFAETFAPGLDETTEVFQRLLFYIGGKADIPAASIDVNTWTANFYRSLVNQSTELFTQSFLENIRDNGSDIKALRQHFCEVVSSNTPDISVECTETR